MPNDFEYAANEITRLTAALAEAEGRAKMAEEACAVWKSVFDGIEAHLIDRINMRDPADPQTYLEIIRGYVARIEEDSRSFVNSRWEDSRRQRSQIDAANARIAELEKLVRSAYHEGFTEGVREHTSYNGGKTWQESKAARSVIKEARVGERFKPQRWCGWRPRIYGPYSRIPRMPQMFWLMEGRAMFGHYPDRHAAFRHIFVDVRRVHPTSKFRRRLALNDNESGGRMSEWQPIDTAPHDGTWIKARGNNFGRESAGHHYAIAFYLDGKWEEVGSRGGVLLYLTDWKPFNE